MAKKNCATDDTHARPRPPAGGRPKPPPRARVGSFVEVTLVAGRPQTGIVISVKADGGKWGTQWLEILFDGGDKLLVKSPTLRVLNYRRRKRR